MKKLTTYVCALTLLGLTATSCGAPQDTTNPKPDMPQTVRYDTVRLTYGDRDGIQTESKTLRRRQALVGEPSKLAELLQNTIFGTNKAIHQAFELIDTAKQNDVTEHQQSWIWETRKDETLVRLEVTSIDDSTFKHLLKIGPDSDSLETAVTGRFTSLAPADGEQAGQGVLNFHLETLEEAGFGDGRGNVILSFRRKGGVKQIRVMFRNFRGSFTEQPLHSINKYTELPDGRTRFKFVGLADVVDSDQPGPGNNPGNGGNGPGNGGNGPGGPTKERLLVDAAWTDARAGRAALEAKGASVGRPHRVDQCWNEAQDVVWASSEPQINSQDGGNRDECVSALDEFELEPPKSLEPPEGEPDIPEPHPDEQSDDTDDEAENNGDADRNNGG